MEIQRIKLSTEDRQLFAVFMGEDPGTHIDFNWLMPVVEKIANTGCMVQIQIDPGFKDVASCMIAKRTKMISFKGGNLLEVTYKAVVEFIRWYNNSQSPDTIK